MSGDYSGQEAQNAALWQRLVASILSTLIICSVVYGVFLGAVFLTADRVECGSIGPIPYCSGVYKDVSVESEQVVRQNVSKYRSTSCYVNGEKVNCSESFLDTNKKYYEEFAGGYK